MGNAFNFDGGDLFSKMGATWFVSYSYYKEIDSSHNNWEFIANPNFRISVFNQSTKYHKFGLEQVLKMNDSKLRTNHINLSPTETKVMAQKVLNKYTC